MRASPIGVRHSGFLPCAVAFGLLVLAACSAEPSWQRLAPQDLSDAQRAASERAEAARDALATRLQARLVAAMQDGGPAAAIDVCRTEAHEITRAISAEQGLRIGRTSHRLRNPGNAPPAWAVPYVEPDGGETVLLAGPDGRLGALYPIRLEARCTICHGTEEQIVPPVREALATHYPDDRATGFAVGDQRGWFWVEVAP